MAGPSQPVAYIFSGNLCQTVGGNGFCAHFTDGQLEVPRGDLPCLLDKKLRADQGQVSPVFGFCSRGQVPIGHLEEGGSLIVIRRALILGLQDAQSCFLHPPHSCDSRAFVFPFAYHVSAPYRFLCVCPGCCRRATEGLDSHSGVGSWWLSNHVYVSKESARTALGSVGTPIPSFPKGGWIVGLGVICCGNSQVVEGIPCNPKSSARVFPPMAL